MEALSVFFVVALVALVVIVYMLPAIVASLRNHNNLNAIALATLFFGWTLIGWLACMVWAATDNVDKQARDRQRGPRQDPQDSTVRSDNDRELCPGCQSLNPASATRCANCGASISR